MKMLSELLPVVLFVVAYQLYGIYTATWVLMGSVILQLLWLKLSGRPIEKMHWITLAVVLVFGGLTLGLHDPLFIMWKPTVINWAFAAALLFSGWFMRRGLLQRMLENVADFPAAVVNRLNYAWVLFLFSLGALNLYIAYNFSEDVWVNFKLFGMMGLTLVFAIGQGFYLARHMPPESQPAAPAASED